MQNYEERFQKTSHDDTNETTKHVFRIPVKNNYANKRRKFYASLFRKLKKYYFSQIDYIFSILPF